MSILLLEPGAAAAAPRHRGSKKCHPGTDISRLDALQKALSGSHSGNQKKDRLLENAKAADIMLSPQEVTALDAALEHMEMSQVLGGTAVSARK